VVKNNEGKAYFSQEKYAFLLDIEINSDKIKVELQLKF